jgi:hypothetical protein
MSRPLYLLRFLPSLYLLIRDTISVPSEPVTSSRVRITWESYRWQVFFAGGVEDSFDIGSDGACSKSAERQCWSALE